MTITEAECISLVLHSMLSLLSSIMFYNYMDDMTEMKSQ